MRWWSRAKQKVKNFAAGSDSRRMATIPSVTSEINNLISRYGNATRARSRYLVLNEPLVTSGMMAFADSLIGDGIKPSSLVQEKTVREGLNNLWTRNIEYMDAEGVLDVYGLQHLIAKELFIAGEVFVRIRKRRTTDGLEVPLQFQVLPAEMLPIELEQQFPRIRMGIEFDVIGRRTAYHFLREHPAAQNYNLTGEIYSRVPADQVLHIYDPIFAGQIRGIPRTVSAITSIAMMSLYDDAELTRKKTSALFAGFIRRPELKDTDNLFGPLETSIFNNVSQQQATLDPGAMVTLLPGEDIAFASPTDVGPNYDAFRYAMLLRVAAGMGIPYHMLTGDVSRGNFSSQRVAIQDFRRSISRIQYGIIGTQFVIPGRRAFLNAAAVVGASPVSLAEMEVDREVLACRLIPAKWDWVDPLKDMQAEALAVEKGFKARSDTVEANGYDPEETDERRAADKEREDSLGLAPAQEERAPSGNNSDSPPADPEGSKQQKKDSEDD